jgi:hypothetical protein
MNIDQVYDKYESAVADIEGDNGKFVQGWDVDACYLLNPGQYTMLLHLNDPGEEKTYALVVKSSQPLQITYAFSFCIVLSLQHIFGSG